MCILVGPNISIAAKPSADILEGNKIILQCIDCSNVPSKNFSWERNGSLLTDATSSVLEIYDVTKKDSGIYACHVQNMIGSSGSSIRVNVYRKKKLLFQIKKCIKIMYSGTILDYSEFFSYFLPVSKLHACTAL